MRENINTTKATTGLLNAGIRTPQIQIQFTPLFWQLSFVYQRTNKIPNKVGFGVGPIALVFYFGPGSWECNSDLVTSTAYSKKKADGR